MKRWIVVAVAVLLLVPVMASAQGVSSEVVPGWSFVRVGGQVSASVLLHGEGVGSYTGYLWWNPAILQYASHSGAPPAGFAGVVNAQQPGRLIFNGANAYGSGPETTLIVVTFDVVGGGYTALDLEYTSMARAGFPFPDLLPDLTVWDGMVWAWGFTRIPRGLPR